MGKAIGNSLKDFVIALRNVSARLFLSHPIFVILFFGFIWLMLYYFSQSDTKMTFALCVLISFVSIIIYSQTKNYGETLLTFMLGVVTVFTIQWTTYSSILFISFYIGFNTVIFMLSSISISSKMETELTAAASFIDLKNHKSIYKILQVVANTGTEFNNIGPLNRAKAVKFMAFMKMQPGEMTDGLKNIEYIKVIYQLEIERACEIFRILYFITQRTNASINVTIFLDEIVWRRIPLTPTEFFNIIGRTKGTIIRENLSVQNYLTAMEKLVMEGYEEEEIISYLNNLKNK